MPRFRLTDIPKLDRKFYTPQVIHDIRSTTAAEQESPQAGRPKSDKYNPQLFWHYHNPQRVNEAILVHSIPLNYQQLKLSPDERYFFSFLQDSNDAGMLEYMGKSEGFSIYHVLPEPGQVETTNKFISMLLDQAKKTRKGNYLIPIHSQQELDILQNLLVDARYRDKEFANEFVTAFYSKRLHR